MRATSKVLRARLRARRFATSVAACTPSSAGCHPPSRCRPQCRHYVVYYRACCDRGWTLYDQYTNYDDALDAAQDLQDQGYNTVIR